MAISPNSKGFYTPFLIALLVVAAFLLGMLITKIQYLERGSSPTTAGAPSLQQPGADLVSTLTGYVSKLGLDSNKFKTCVTSGKYKDKVAQDLAAGEKLEVRGTPGFFINGKFVGGAFPLESFKEIIDKELAGTGSQNYKEYSQQLQNAYEQGKSFDPVPKAVEVGNAPVRGALSAKVTIVEFSDFQCPFCAKAHPTIQQILKDYDGKVRVAYKHFPIAQIHPNAQKTAEASECANEQKKFWEYHDMLFENQNAWARLP